MSSAANSERHPGHSGAKAARRWPSHQIQMALDAVSQAFAQVKAEPTPAEAALWADEIDRMGPGPIMSFIKFWMSGGGQDGYLRAPRIDDARRFVDPEWMDAGAALQLMHDLVRSVGPYRVPDKSEGMSQRLQSSIAALGGWARVCEIMPEPSQEFAWREFAKRFDAAWSQAQARELMGLPPAAPLKSLAATQSAKLECVVGPDGHAEHDNLPSERMR